MKFCGKNNLGWRFLFLFFSFLNKDCDFNGKVETWDVFLRSVLLVRLMGMRFLCLRGSSGRWLQERQRALWWIWYGRRRWPDGHFYLLGLPALARLLWLSVFLRSLGARYISPLIFFFCFSSSLQTSWEYCVAQLLLEGCSTITTWRLRIWYLPIVLCFDCYDLHTSIESKF